MIIEVLAVTGSTTGWMTYCHAGIQTDIVDINGTVLKTGDIVEILERYYYELGEDRRISKSMIVFDQFKRFVSDDKSYVEGWYKVEWNTDRDYLIRKVDEDNKEGSHFRIVE